MAPEPAERYYAPQGTLLVTGGLSFSTWLGVGEFSSLNLGLRAAAGPYYERLFGAEGGRTERIQIELQGDLGFTRGDAYYYLRGAYSANNEDWTTAIDYWSVNVTLGFSTAMPRLLAP